jgi:DNA-binding transcriptional LysR family regulator
VGFDQETAFIRRVRERFGNVTREMFALRADSDLAQLAAIRAGFGIGFCQVALGRRDGLVRVLPQKVSAALETWIAMHEDLRESPRCVAAFDALVAGLGAYAHPG